MKKKQSKEQSQEWAEEAEKGSTPYAVQVEKFPLGLIYAKNSDPT